MDYSSRLGVALRAVSNVFGAIATLFLLFLMFGITLDAIVRAIYGHSIPGLFEMSELSLVVIVFFGLGWTQMDDAHIRVTLLLNFLKGGAKKAFEIWALAIATLLAVLFAVYSCKLAWQSHEFHDISTSSDATPLWIPQIAMALGTVILAIAFLDELVLEMMGKRVDASSGEALRNE